MPKNLTTVLQEERENVTKELCDFCLYNVVHTVADCGMEKKTVSPYRVMKALTDYHRTVLAAVDTVIGSIGTGPSVDGTGSEYDKGYWGAVQDIRGLIKAALETK